MLREARRAHLPLWLIATIRTEFLDSSLHNAAFDDLVDDVVLVGPLDRSRLSEVIEGPARKAGIEFEPGLVDRMVDDTSGGDALPLLAFTLEQLYARGDASTPIPHSDYTRLVACSARSPPGRTWLSRTFAEPAAAR